LDVYALTSDFKALLLVKKEKTVSPWWYSGDGPGPGTNYFG